MTVDDQIGGAIEKPHKIDDSPPKTAFTSQRREDFVVSEDEYYSFEHPQNKYDHYYNALNMNPRNMFPYSQYESSMAGEDPNYVKNILLKGLSGHGSHKDSLPIQRAVIHSLKKHPPLLHMYMNSAKLAI